MTIHATAAILRARNTPYTLESVELADPGAGQLLVKIHACGICHTDVGVQTIEQGLPLPQVLGHEGTGTVLAIGAGVTSVAPGDRVVLSYASCGACPNCVDAAPQYCAQFMALNYAGVLPDGAVPMQSEQGPVYGAFFGQSSFATHAIAYERNAVRIEDDLGWDVLAPLGCGMQTGAGAVYNTLAPTHGQSIVVFGTGSVGMAALMAAADLGCAPLVAVDINPERLALARDLGATHCIPAGGHDLAQALHEILPQGFEFAVDTTGVAPVIRAGVEALAPRGQLVVLAVTPPGTEVAINPNSLLGGKILRGVVEGDADPRDFIPRLLDRHRAGRFPHDRLVRTYPFSAINEAVADMRAGRVIKPVLLME